MSTLLSLARLRAVSAREFRMITRNRLGFLLSVVAPVALFLLFSYGLLLDVKNIPLVIFDEDRSEKSRKVLDAFAHTEVFDLKGEIHSLQEVESYFKGDLAEACLVIPRDFQKDLDRGRPVETGLFIDASYTGRALIIKGYAEAILGQLDGEWVSLHLEKREGGGLRGLVPAQMEVAPWFNPNLESSYFIVPGTIALLLVFLPPMICAIAISGEMESGAILSMYASPVSRTEYLLGKMLPYALLAFVDFLAFLFLTMAIFRVPLRGDPLLLGAVTLAYIVASLGIGVLVAVLTRRQISAVLVTAMVTIMPVFMYSGYLTPLNCLPASVKSNAYALASTYYIDFIRKLMVKGTGFQYQVVNVVAILLIGALIYGVSIACFKKRLG